LKPQAFDLPTLFQRPQKVGIGFLVRKFWACRRERDLAATGDVALRDLQQHSREYPAKIWALGSVRIDMFF